MTEREAVLDRRVRWLDRRRRAIAATVGVLAALVVAWELAAMWAYWSRIHAGALCLIAGLVAWFVAEVGIAWVTALWEAELDRSLDDRGLPRAELRARRWPR